MTDAEREADHALRQDATIQPPERDRVEVVLLSDAGWPAGRIATHLVSHPATVRGVLKRFCADGPSSLRRSPPGPPPDTARRERVETALGALLEKDRTWTAAQVAARRWLSQPEQAVSVVSTVCNRTLTDGADNADAGLAVTTVPGAATASS